MWTNHITGTCTAIVYSSQNQEITKPQLIIGQGNMIIGELTPLSFHTFLLFKYPIRVKLTQNILREILDISLDYWWLRYKCLSDMGGFSLGWNLTKSAFGLSIEFRDQAHRQYVASKSRDWVNTTLGRQPVLGKVSNRFRQPCKKSHIFLENNLSFHLEWYYIISVVKECHMLKYPPSKLLYKKPNSYLMWHFEQNIACYILKFHSMYN